MSTEDPEGWDWAVGDERMPAIKIELNFFPVHLPDRPVPFLMRRLQPDDRLGRFEHEWSSESKEAGTNERWAVLLRNAKPIDPAGYETRESRLHEMQPTIVKRLCEAGLASTLFGRNYVVRKRQLSFLCFRSDEQIRDGVPPFLRIRRGVEFWIDHLSHRGQRTYGFFAFPCSRQEFQMGMEDAKLAEAAMGESVDVFGHGDRDRGILLTFDASAKKARLSLGEENIEVPFGNISIPASRTILDKYCRATSQVSENKKARVAVRAASFRYKLSGAKNPRWLKDQIEYTCGWLLHASQNGRVMFRWPNSTIDVVLGTRPAEASERVE